MSISKVSFTKKENRNKCTPQRFMCHNPIYEMKLVATRIPNMAGYQSPSFLSEGEKTPGKLKTIHMNPRIHTMVTKTGRFIAAPCIADN
ncbi:MAG: hypothetical protein K0S44_2580 [Bacteroidetes bacterium]|jgi:hypothetical protein|nr:hypothetical protein [Bacteroidota bacterium]